MSERVSCKECKYCKRDWFGTVPFMWGSPYFYKCTKSLKEEEVEWDPVTGKEIVTKKHYPSCPTMRSRFNDECGEEGKYWEPKYEKDLFKYIKRS
jgi:hypothetical protein